MCQCVLRAHMLTYQRAMRANVRKWQRTLRAYVFTCQRILRDYVLAYLACSRAHVLTCFNVLTYQRTFACLPVDKQRYQKYQMYIFISNIIYNIKYQIAKISSNIKNKFPITCFLLFLIFFLFLFPVKLNCIWKVHDKRECLYNFFFFFFFVNLIVHSGIPLTRRKPLTSATTNFVQQNGLIFAWVELWGD